MFRWHLKSWAVGSVLFGSVQFSSVRFSGNGRCTLQGVEDGEQVGEGQVDGSPGEQSEAPRHPEQEGEAHNAPEVPKNLDRSGGFNYLNISNKTFKDILDTFGLNLITKSWFHWEMFSCKLKTVSTDLFSQGAVAAFAVAAADLHHHYDEHGHVEQEHQAEITNAGCVENTLLLDPTPERKHATQEASAKSLVASVTSHPSCWLP